MDAKADAEHVRAVQAVLAGPQTVYTLQASGSGTPVGYTSREALAEGAREMMAEHTRVQVQAAIEGGVENMKILNKSLADHAAVRVTVPGAISLFIQTLKVVA